MPESERLNVVEIPDDTLPAVWAPELAGIPGSRIGDKSAVRLLANTIAHQWWGSEVSPHSLNDAWIVNGMCRYGELMYLEDESGSSALRAALTDVAASALAYDTIPLSSSGRLGAFSPEFQSMTFDKGAMIFHMLRWEVGEKMLPNIFKGVLSQYADKSLRTSDFEKVAEEVSQQQLLPFFSQWIDGTGAPKFTDKYAVYRLGNNKGFRTIGEIDQDLDLFRMPVDLRIETDGKTVNQKIEVVGTNTQYVVDTFGRPRRISVDPQDWVLKTTPDLQVRIAILKGQQLVAQGDLVGALAAYQKALESNPQSSLASYRIGEVLFTQRNYQASVNSFRDSLRGDDEPPWTECWSHIAIGKIFDLHRPARPRHQRVPPRRANQRQHPGLRKRRPPVPAKALHRACAVRLRPVFRPFTALPHPPNRGALLSAGRRGDRSRRICFLNAPLERDCELNPAPLSVPPHFHGLIA